LINKARILIVEPKRHAAYALFRRVQDELQLQNSLLTIGAKLGFGDNYGQVDNPRPNILYSTGEHICRKYLKRLHKLMKHYTHIILDEIHERTLEHDLLLLVLKILLLSSSSNGRKLKIILLSATVDFDIFRQYFLQYQSNSLQVVARSFGYPINNNNNNNNNNHYDANLSTRIQSDFLHGKK
jgi:HrpA-like RNA helicase